MDGDGFVDFAVGAYGGDNGDSQEGAIYIVTMTQFTEVNLTLSTGTISETSGSTILTATLSGGTTNTLPVPVTVTFSYSGTAAGGDYSVSSGSIEIPAGSTTGSLTLTAITDAIVEGTETVDILINTLSYGYSGANSGASVSILDGPVFSTGDFVSTWKTDNPGTSNSTSISIPVQSALTYNYDVDWNNDGIFDQFGLTTGVTHDYGTAGTYTVRIRGDFPSIYFNNEGDKQKILSVSQW